MLFLTVLTSLITLKQKFGFEFLKNTVHYLLYCYKLYFLLFIIIFQEGALEYSKDKCKKLDCQVVANSEPQKM